MNAGAGDGPCWVPEIVLEDAIARLGAKQDGVLRQHQILPDGSRRDTVVFSILDSEWTSVRNGLNTGHAP